jgi:hypothetical protein
MSYGAAMSVMWLIAGFILALTAADPSPGVSLCVLIAALWQIASWIREKL